MWYKNNVLTFRKQNFHENNMFCGIQAKAAI